MNPLTQSKNTTIRPVLIALALGCFALSPRVQAVDPPPDGGYPGQNTAEGEDAPPAHRICAAGPVRSRRRGDCSGIQAHDDEERVAAKQPDEGVSCLPSAGSKLAPGLDRSRLNE